MSRLRFDKGKFIFLEYYDEVKKRNTSRSLKLLQDREGKRKAREILKKFDAEVALNDLRSSHRVNIRTQITFSEGLRLFFEDKAISEKPIKPKTKEAHLLAAKHFKDALKDRNINTYTEKDGVKFNEFLEVKGFSQASRGIHTRHLHAVFNYFVKKGYAATNIIKRVPPPEADPIAIPPDDLEAILNYFKNGDGKDFKGNIKHYNYVLFSLYTGFRVSSVLAQRWEWIFLDMSIMKAYNKKADRYFYFAIHDELAKLLVSMNPKQEGRLFDFVEKGSPVFWRKRIPKLVKDGKIKRSYTLHQLRKTFGSLSAESGVEIAVLRKMLDHSTTEVTQKHYVQSQINLMRRMLNRVFERGKTQEISGDVLAYMKQIIEQIEAQKA